jgi:hypothetical protein
LTVYDPPSQDNWVLRGRFSESYKRAYDEGFQAAKDGKPQDDNPYVPTGHERDTGHADDLHYYWWSGWEDFIDVPLPYVEAGHE